MTEALIVGLVTASGFMVLLPFRRLHSGFGLAWFAPVMGTAVFVLVAVLLVSVESFFTSAALALTAVVAIAVVSLWWWRERPEAAVVKALARQLAVALVVISVLVVVLQQISLTRVSFDSYWYLMSANALEQHGGMSAVPFSFHEILKRQLVVPVIQAGGALTGRGYIIAWIPVVAISAVSSTVWLAWQGGALSDTPRRWRALIAVVTVAFIATTNQFLFHMFYINGHMVFAAFLLVGVGLAWYAAVCGDWHLLIPSSIVFASLIPLRAEALIVIVMFVLPIVTTLDKPSWTRWVPAAPIAVVTLVWYGWAIQGEFPDLAMGDRLTVFGNLVFAFGLLVVAVLADNRRLRVLMPYVSWMPLIALIGVVALQIITGFEDVWSTVSVLAVNVATEGLWGALWWMAPLLVFGAYIAISFPFQRNLLIPLLTFAVALPAFAFLRGGSYRVGFGDSGNRMMMHVVLIVALYLMLAANTAASTSPPRQKSEAH